MSVRGPITSAWRRSGDTLLLQVEIPANVTATVLLPGAPAAEDEDGVHAVRRDGDHWAVDVGSGRYRFSAALARRPGHGLTG